MRYHIDFIKKRKVTYLLSMILSLITICSIFFNGFNLGIDFSGGVLIEITAPKINTTIINSTLHTNGYNNFVISQVNDNQYIIKFPQMIINHSIPKIKTSTDATTIIYESKHQYIAQDILDLLKNSFDELKIEKTEFVGPKAGKDFVFNSIKAVILALCGMMIYTWIRFKWYFGLGVILALLHDVIITLGFFSITRIQFDFTSIAVLLTVIGYSINDSIVIYDRIRANLEIKSVRNKNELMRMINNSINETLSRTLLTSITTLVVCLTLGVLGGNELKGFGYALSFGIAFGTYSSIYISAPILLFFNKKITL